MSLEQQRSPILSILVKSQMKILSVTFCEDTDKLEVIQEGEQDKERFRMQNDLKIYTLNQADRLEDFLRQNKQY